MRKLKNKPALKLQLANGLLFFYLCRKGTWHFYNGKKAKSTTLTNKIYKSSWNCCEKQFWSIHSNIYWCM